MAGPKAIWASARSDPMVVDVCFVGGLGNNVIIDNDNMIDIIDVHYCWEICNQVLL
jgi:hypothetical protein